MAEPQQSDLLLNGKWRYDDWMGSVESSLVLYESNSGCIFRMYAERPLGNRGWKDLLVYQ